MKFLCSQCDGLSEITQFRIEAQTLIITCSRCGKESQSSSQGHPNQSIHRVEQPGTEPTRTPPKAEPIADDEFIVPAGHCPKCLSPRASNATCPSCGLPPNADGAAFEPGVWLKAEWCSLAQNWSDASQHQALRQQAFVRNELAGMGRLYRLKLAKNPDDAIAQRGREEVVNMAMVSSFTAEKTPSATRMSKNQLRLLGALVASALVAVMALLSKLLGA